MTLVCRVYDKLARAELALVALRVYYQSARVGEEHFAKRVGVLLRFMIPFKLEEMHVRYFGYFQHVVNSFQFEFHTLILYLR